MAAVPCDGLEKEIGIDLPAVSLRVRREIVAAASGVGINEVRVGATRRLIQVVAIETKPGIDQLPAREIVLFFQAS